LTSASRATGTFIAQRFSAIRSRSTAAINLPGGVMNDHIYKKVELTGSSKTSIEEAIQNAITRASHTLRNIHWFEVVETRGYIENGKVDYWQVTVKLGFRLEDES
jgi:flavin-binding protein dodecin